MFDERAYISRLESADAAELFALLRRPGADEEAALRTYLGDARYRRLHDLALRRIRADCGGRRGNVIVIPGELGSELTAYKHGKATKIWIQVQNLTAGGMEQLRLDEEGRQERDPDYQVRATGILIKHYGELIMSLARRWRVRTYWFDWRKDLEVSAADLAAKIAAWFGDGSPFHIVAHSMGGLVARTLIKNHPEVWRHMGGRELSSGGRLIMLGTPNHGTFAVPQILTGLEGMVRKLARIDLQHDRKNLLGIFRTFRGFYQMMPSHLKLRAALPLYDPETWGDWKLPKSLLDPAKAHHEGLAGTVDAERMIYLAGCNQATPAGVDLSLGVDRREAYSATLAGDGWVSHELGQLAGVPTFFVEEEHGGLPGNKLILRTLDELLETGKTGGLPDRLPTDLEVPAGDEEASRRLQSREGKDDRDLEAYLRRSRFSRTAATAQPGYLSSDERLVEDVLTRGFLSASDFEQTSRAPAIAADKPEIEIRLVHAGIQDVHGVAGETLPVDAIAVGHYAGMRPSGATYWIDRAISEALHPSSAGKEDDDETRRREEDCVLTQLTERRILRGELGLPFLLSDPRTAPGLPAGRVIVVAGMGIPGRFGEPELMVLSRELVWTVGRLGKRHLATVLIGSGTGNLSDSEAMSGWLRGLCHALAGAAAGGQRILRLTFCEYYPDRILQIDRAIEEQVRAHGSRLAVDYAPLSDEQRRRLRSEHLTRYRAWFEKKMTALRNASSAPRGEEKPPQEPTRLTLSLEQNTYRFGAITAEASIPEREVTLDRALVATANDELAGESDRRLQVERGRLMEGLLLPKDLRPHLRSQAPLVLLLDATTARIHWEMVAQPELPGLGNDGGGLDGEESLPFRDAFLGTARGLTRQLRTTFSQAPEPPPPRRRVLRVLIVADPAEDAHLPGAEEEGAAVADLFESFNSLYHDVPDNRVDVTRLFGPRDATRTNVLRRIMLDRYDVLHFAGHCFFDREDPAGSGWVFSDGGILSARELRRLDRIPGFVFSNACESGITPDRSEKRSVNAAPSFAEAFFERGVANFVVTAWPVDDRAAQRFARRLYADLLGIRMNDARERSGSQEELARCTPLPMFQAMRNARLEIAETPNGARTWGAYQHYGSPYFRFFDERALRPKPPEEATRAGARKATPRPAKPKGRTRKKSPSKSRGKRS